MRNQLPNLPLFKGYVYGTESVVVPINKVGGCIMSTKKDVSEQAVLVLSTLISAVIFGLFLAFINKIEFVDELSSHGEQTEFMKELMKESPNFDP